MGPVRHLRNPAPLALMATLMAVVLSACGSGSSSSTPSAGPTNQLEVRPIYARYTPGHVSLGPQLPKALVATLDKHPCPTPPQVVDDMILECDPTNTIFLLKDPIITGGVAQATATHIGKQKLWYVKATLTPGAAAKMKAATQALGGTELAYSLGGKILTTIIVDAQYDPAHLVLLGNYDQAQAQQLASSLTKS
jgi:hypothetical protein